MLAIFIVVFCLGGGGFVSTFFCGLYGIAAGSFVLWSITIFPSSRHALLYFVFLASLALLGPLQFSFIYVTVFVYLFLGAAHFRRLN